MSEFRTEDALDRLIGSFESGKPGLLASRLREKPYGVLLLDEFEKATKEVNELFLQVLDEGFFSDMRGKKVSARNLMIIATSNAGSDLIWEYNKKGIDVSEKTRELTDAIIARGIFKPELLNRFDGVITFHPLSKEHIKIIAGMMLGKLKNRLEKKGIEFIINDAVIAVLMRYGYDPQFGARPMQRAVADRIEEVVARKMLEGTVSAGSRIELTEKDFPPDEGEVAPPSAVQQEEEKPTSPPGPKSEIVKDPLQHIT
jgi:ATP-dependent Clp protease ATP-binding subunit ClpB